MRAGIVTTAASRVRKTNGALVQLIELRRKADPHLHQDLIARPLMIILAKRLP
jgi:hypothetical protein